jgi:hypothetical protein
MSDVLHPPIFKNVLKLQKSLAKCATLYIEEILCEMQSFKKANQELYNVQYYILYNVSSMLLLIHHMFSLMLFMRLVQYYSLV